MLYPKGRSIYRRLLNCRGRNLVVCGLFYSVKCKEKKRRPVCKKPVLVYKVHLFITGTFLLLFHGDF
jgi:hypothetical protein